MNILIVYASKEGQTETIAQFIAEAIHKQGHQTTVLPGNHLPNGFATDPFDAAIIGGSIHMSDYPGYLKKFVITHRDWLNQVPSAFFTVCMAIHSKNAEEQQQARSFGAMFTSKTSWHPNMMETFAGAIKYTQYGFITRLIMRNIAKKEGGDTDTSRDHEYTDWDAVTRFTEQFLIQLEVKRV
jgi:menaquinone-dependent protoporphyrinogen oxidase